MARPQGSHLRVEMKGGATPLDGTANGLQQHIVVERLGQELDGSSLHRLHAHRHVTMAGDEDDRHIRSLGELLLQLETVEPWKRYVEHQATRNSGANARQEFRRRGERFGLPACGADEQLQRFAHGDVVINDEDNRRDVRHGKDLDSTACGRRARVYGRRATFPVNIVVIPTAPEARR